MIKVTMPKLGLTMTEGTIIEWRGKEGEEVKKGEILFIIETEKVSYEVEASESGILGKIVAQEGDVVPVGGIVAYIIEPGEELAEIPELVTKQAAKAPVDVETEVAATQAIEMSSKIKISPLARRAAQDHNVDISTIKGTGPSGRIVKEDVLRAIEEMKAPAAQPPPKEEEGGREEIKPLSSMRRVIARRMTETFTVPHFYSTVEVDAEELGKVREGLIPMVEGKTGVRLTYTDLLIKMVAQALEDNPALNCSYVDGSVRLFKQIDIGVVAAVEGGLVVPVIRQANKKSLVEITAIRAELAQKARERRLSKEEMTGSTFTISNLGMFGIDQFSALLQPPEAAILAVGRMMEKPVVRDRQIVIRPMMNLTLSIDHRVLDGVAGANFLQSLKGYIENPALCFYKTQTQGDQYA